MKNIEIALKSLLDQEGKFCFWTLGCVIIQETQTATHNIMNAFVSCVSLEMFKLEKCKKNAEGIILRIKYFF